MAREGQTVKKWSVSSRGPFSRPIDFWSRSGQNDATRFRDFLGTVGKEGSVDLNVEGKRMIIMFSCFKCGTPYEDMSLLEVTKKQISGPSVAGYEDGHGGGDENARSGRRVRGNWRRSLQGNTTTR